MYRISNLGIFLGKLTVLLTAACAAERGAVQPFDPDRVVLSKAAAELTSERKASAALAGTEAAKDAELVCERRPQPGTHMVETYCYTREEWLRKRGRH